MNWKDVLRWVAVLPGALAASFLGTLLWRLFLWLQSPSWAPTNLWLIIDYLFNQTSPGIILVVASWYIAPKFKRITALVIGGWFTIIALIWIGLNIAQKDYEQIMMQALLAISLIGTMIYIAYDSDYSD